MRVNLWELIKILTKNYKHRYSEVKYFMDKKNAGDISMKRFYCQLYCYSTSDEINRSHRIWCLVTNKLFFSLSSSCILFTCIVASAYMLPVLVLPLYFSFVCVTCVNKNRQLLAVTASFFLFFFGNCSVKPIGLKILISPPVFFFFLCIWHEASHTLSTGQCCVLI